MEDEYTYPPDVVELIRAACLRGHDSALDPFVLCWFMDECADSAANYSKGDDEETPK